MAAARLLLDELETCLRQSNMRALTISTHLQQDFSSQLGAPLAPLHTAVQQLDFAQALRLCTELRNRLGVAQPPR